jgi:hypothetical protein
MIFRKIFVDIITAISSAACSDSPKEEEAPLNGRRAPSIIIFVLDS